MIKPTVGRIVYYIPPAEQDPAYHISTNGTEPLAAIVACVHSDTMLNLAVFDCNGTPHARTSVPLVQPNEATPEHGDYCYWMPYQVTQASQEVAKAVSTPAPAFVANPTSAPK